MTPDLADIGFLSVLLSNHILSVAAALLAQPTSVWQAWETIHHFSHKPFCASDFAHLI